jgi:hypothetical protein
VTSYISYPTETAFAPLAQDFSTLAGFALLLLRRRFSSAGPTVHVFGPSGAVPTPDVVEWRCGREDAATGTEFDAVVRFFYSQTRISTRGKA